MIPEAATLQWTGIVIGLGAVAWKWMPSVVHIGERDPVTQAGRIPG